MKLTGKIIMYETHAELFEFENSVQTHSDLVANTYWRISVSGNLESELYESLQEAKNEIDRRLSRVMVGS